MKNIRIFYLKNCHFFVVKFSVYLNRRVFVMWQRFWESESMGSRNIQNVMKLLFLNCSFSHMYSL